MTSRVQWEVTQDGILRPVLYDKGRVIYPVWAPQEGSQEAFLTCPVFETLYEGTRGPGKTDALLMDFAQHCGQGYGAEWRGILFRQTYKQLTDLINKSQKWFREVFPEATYNKADHTWTWPSGEQLLLRHMRTPSDYWNYHGHAYPWIGFEELTNWAEPTCYLSMMSCSRSTVPGMPRKYRSTTNPYGPGHNWVKRRWRLPQSRGRIIRDSYRDGELEPPRVAIHGHIRENRILLHADPEYISRIRASARNPAELAAWIDGSWDVTSGGMFDDIWDSGRHILPSFPLHKIPKGWHIDRSFDWGSSKPFSVGWWAESNGEPLEYNGVVYGRKRGDLIRIAEWYGWNGNRNEGVRMLAKDIAQGILDREDDLGIAGRVRPGPADTSIFDEENGVSIARDMLSKKVSWEKADKSPGSRKQGWEAIRKMLKGALPPPGGGPREEPGLFVLERCHQFIETVPSLPRDEKDPDDVNTNAEDHIADETRYRVRHVRKKVASGGF